MTANKLLVITGAVIVCILFALGFGCYKYYNKAQTLQSEVDRLTITNKALSSTIEQNDIIASNTINTLNSSLSDCQAQQNDLISFCDKRVQLALESRETEIITELQNNYCNVTNKPATSGNEQPLIGIDADSSRKYIIEINDIVNKLNKK